MQHIYPWNAPHEDFTSLINEAWWAHMNRHFERSCLSLGVPPELAEKAAGHVREVLLRPENYVLFDDAVPVLQRLRDLGFRQHIISNNHPDLLGILSDLQLDAFFESVTVSGEIGYDKPRREIFDMAFEKAGRPGCCFMVGDNPVADGEGAKNAGIPPLLVHLPTPVPSFPCFFTLNDAADYMMEESSHAFENLYHSGL